MDPNIIQKIYDGTSSRGCLKCNFHQTLALISSKTLWKILLAISVSGITESFIRCKSIFLNINQFSLSALGSSSMADTFSNQSSTFFAESSSLSFFICFVNMAKSSGNGQIPYDNGTISFFSAIRGKILLNLLQFFKRNFLLSTYDWSQFYSKLMNICRIFFFQSRL